MRGLPTIFSPKLTRIKEAVIEYLESKKDVLSFYKEAEWRDRYERKKSLLRRDLHL